MRKSIFLVSLVLCFISVRAQNVGIGTTTPDASAQLDITHTSKGLLIPRMTTSFINSISNPAKGLMVYDSVKSQLMVNMGTASAPNWQTIVFNSGWGLTGNTNISPTNNFIGTTDASPVKFRVNNVIAGFVDTGTANTGFGFRNLDLMTTGSFNSAFGYKALTNNSVGLGNTALGSNALRFTSTGSYNTAGGYLSMQLNTAGDSNTAYGSFSLNRNDAAAGNTAIGMSAMYWTGAPFNTAVGFESLNQNFSGTHNTAMGASSLWNTTNSSYNVAIGDSAGFALTFGNEGTYVGFLAGRGAINNSSYAAVAVGSHTADSSCASWSTVLGNYAGRKNQVQGNTFVGSSAGMRNVSGEATFVGDNAGINNTTGNFNTALGTFSLDRNVVGNFNTAIGAHVLYWNLGDHNTGLGFESLNSNTIGADNAAGGHLSLYSNIEGNGNTAFGDSAAFYNVGGNYNTAIGYKSDVGPNFVNSTAVGANATATRSNLMAFGDSKVTGWVFGRTNTSNPSVALQVGFPNPISSPGNGALLTVGGVWTNSSDMNLKENFIPLEGNDVLNRINQLRITQWNYKGTHETHIGPMAQQFKQLFNLGMEGDDKTISTMDPAGIALVGIQQLSEMVKQQQKTIDVLKKEMELLKEQNEKLTLLLTRKN